MPSVPITRQGAGKTMHAMQASIKKKLKPAPKKKKVSAETITDGQAWAFANKLAYYHPFGSRFAKAGEEYDEFINRIAEDLKKPERFDLFRPYMVKLNLIDEEIDNDGTQA